MKEGFVAGLWLCGIWLVTMAACYAFDRAGCYAATADMGYEVEYGLLSGCRVIVGDRLIPLKVLRINQWPDNSRA